MYPFDRNGYPIYPGCVILNVETSSVGVVDYCTFNPNSWLGMALFVSTIIMWDVGYVSDDSLSTESRFSYEAFQVIPCLEIIERHVM
jgi:hypothetical protein